jgi:2-polyprenyl-3-methyl-5-hydroxy-6-metoxy-1,4-benzoquinol methylase
MYPLPKLKIFNNSYQGMELIQKYIKEKAETVDILQIMEAGCGRKWPIDLTGIQYVLTGVDRDEVALELRKNIKKDLHKAIVGDLLTVSIPQKFDIIYNAYVLEHIEEAEKVLSIFDKWIKNQGIIILLIPDPHSVRGFITRFTPHWFHVFCYKYILKIKNAGEKGYAPYPTYYSPVVSRVGIRDFCAKNHFLIKEEYGFSYRVYGKGLIAHFIKPFAFLISLFSLGKLSYQHCNLLYILEKEPYDQAA